MSRAHLEIRRVDGRVFIIDRQSKNGVAIRPAGQTQWIRIAPWQPIVWLPGMSVRIGSRILRLETTGQRPTLWNEPIIPIAVRTAEPANNQRAAAPPSSASTVRINHADKCGHAIATAPSSASTVRINHANKRGHAIPTAPSSASTVRINHADRCGHAIATPHPATHNGARTRRSAMRELFSEVEMISATIQPTASAAPRKTGPIAATSGRYGA
jgi:hypothetical protein